MAKTIPRNDFTQQLNDFVDEIHQMEDPLNFLPRVTVCGNMPQHVNRWKLHQGKEYTSIICFSA